MGAVKRGEPGLGPSQHADAAPTLLLGLAGSLIRHPTSHMASKSKRLQDRHHEPSKPTQAPDGVAHPRGFRVTRDKHQTGCNKDVLRSWTRALNTGLPFAAKMNFTCPSLALNGIAGLCPRSGASRTAWHLELESSKCCFVNNGLLRAYCPGSASVVSRVKSKRIHVEPLAVLWPGWSPCRTCPLHLGCFARTTRPHIIEKPVHAPTLRTSKRLVQARGLGAAIKVGKSSCNCCAPHHSCQELATCTTPSNNNAFQARKQK